MYKLAIIQIIIHIRTDINEVSTFSIILNTAEPNSSIRAVVQYDGTIVRNIEFIIHEN